MKLISIGVHENKLACSLRNDGKLVKETVWNYRGDGNSYDKYLEAIKKSISYVRGYITENKDNDVVVFEVSNSVIVKWLDTCKCNKRYRKQLDTVLGLIDDIPMRYIFSKVDKPRCNFSVKASLMLSGVDDLE